MGEDIIDWYHRVTAERWGQGRRLAALRAGVAYTPIHGGAGQHRKESQQRTDSLLRGARPRILVARHQAWQAAAKAWREAHGTAPLPDTLSKPAPIPKAKHRAA